MPTAEIRVKQASSEPDFFTLTRRFARVHSCLETQTSLPTDSAFPAETASVAVARAYAGACTPANMFVDAQKPHILCNNIQLPLSLSSIFPSREAYARQNNKTK